MSDILTRAGCFFAIIVLGYILRRVGFFQASDFKIISKIVMRITLPASIVYSFAGKTIDLSMLLVIVIGFGVGVVHILLCLVLNRKKGKRQQAFEIINSSGLNIGCFSLPFVQSFFGPMGVITTSLFDVGNASICLGGSYSVASMVKNGGRFSVSRLCKSLFKSIPFDCYIISLLLNLAGIGLPGIVLELAEIAGGANVFMAMLMIGVGVELPKEKNKLKDFGRILGMRLVVALIFAVPLFLFLPYPLEARKAIALLFFAPLPSSATAYTGELEEDVGLASAVNSISIICGIVFTVVVLLVVS